jgi:sugar/nucleoside kinase (ribokinase family)
VTVTSASHLRPAHLAVLGDLVLDIVVTSDAHPARGSDVAGSVRFRRGGSAANTARAFALLGGRATFIGAVGRDAWGRRLARSLRTDGVRLRAVTAEEPTARLVAYVGADGERSFVTDRGAADRLSASDLDARWFRGVDALHVPAYSLFARPLADAADRAAALARERGALVSVDLASRAPLRAMGRRRARAAIAALEPAIVFANVDEASALFRRTPEERLLEIAPVAVIKEGALGCRVLARTGAGGMRRIDVATDPLAVTDTTGAGDAFDAGFLFAVLGTEGGWERAAGRVTALRRAAKAGHHAARVLLTSPRAELEGSAAS